jgi:hypothetical protein
MTGFIIFFVCLIAIFLIIIIHECGHFLGGYFSGIPADQMKICLWTFPQYVALKDGESWIRPKDRERFVSISMKFLKTKNKAIVFIASGLVIQTIVSIRPHTSCDENPVELSFAPKKAC